MSWEYDKIIFGTSDLCFFLQSKLPPDPDFCYSYGFSWLEVKGCTQSSITLIKTLPVLTHSPTLHPTLSKIPRYKSTYEMLKYSRI
jgi:hypothetical protein